MTLHPGTLRFTMIRMPPMRRRYIHNDAPILVKTF